jgi:hypothetical protein
MASWAMNVGQSLDGGDPALADVDRQHHAGRNGEPIDQHGTGRAGATVAADFRPGEIERAAQYFGEGGVGRDRHRAPDTVDVQRQRHVAGSFIRTSGLGRDIAADHGCAGADRNAGSLDEEPPGHRCVRHLTPRHPMAS